MGAFPLRGLSGRPVTLGSQHLNIPCFAQKRVSTANATGATYVQAGSEYAAIRQSHRRCQLQYCPWAYTRDGHVSAIWGHNCTSSSPYGLRNARGVFFTPSPSSEPGNVRHVVKNVSYNARIIAYALEGLPHPRAGRARGKRVVWLDNKPLSRSARDYVRRERLPPEAVGMLPNPGTLGP
ncbi:hypothetical protein C8Q73DRAFT_664563 [Cubamyces lactineus]|nr:hypothetical protein C8Q73DRAFT_664563 [Cubamyces lactineus]